MSYNNKIKTDFKKKNENWNNYDLETLKQLDNKQLKENDEFFLNDNLKLRNLSKTLENMKKSKLPDRKLYQVPSNRQNCKEDAFFEEKMAENDKISNVSTSEVSDHQKHEIYHQESSYFDCVLQLNSGIISMKIYNVIYKNFLNFSNLIILFFQFNFKIIKINFKNR